MIQRAPNCTFCFLTVSFIFVSQSIALPKKLTVVFCFFLICKKGVLLSTSRETEEDKCFKNYFKYIYYASWHWQCVQFPKSGTFSLLSKFCTIDLWPFLKCAVEMESWSCPWTIHELSCVFEQCRYYLLTPIKCSEICSTPKQAIRAFLGTPCLLLQCLPLPALPMSRCTKLSVQRGSYYSNQQHQVLFMYFSALDKKDCSL